MRQLEKALERLAQRAESLPTDLLVERLEAQLSEERHLSGQATPGVSHPLPNKSLISLFPILFNTFTWSLLY